MLWSSRLLREKYILRYALQANLQELSILKLETACEMCIPKCFCNFFMVVVEPKTGLCHSDCLDLFNSVPSSLATAIFSSSQLFLQRPMFGGLSDGRRCGGSI